MATADELLQNQAIQQNPEGHIVVGGDRFITVPSNLKRLGVQYDHNIETVTFDCPRYWDDRDMSSMAVYINYKLSDGYADQYPADNVRVDGGIMHFDWTISKNVTRVAGKLSFTVCIKNTDSEGNESQHWNSELCQDCYISQGMENEESPVDTNPDILTQLLTRITTVENYIRDNDLTIPGGDGGLATRLVNLTLPSSEWTGADHLYSQVVTIPGITKYTKVDLLPSVEQLAIFFNKNISFVTENENGIVTVYAIGDKPLMDYTMQAQITEVTV